MNRRLFRCHLSRRMPGVFSLIAECRLVCPLRACSLFVSGVANARTARNHAHGHANHHCRGSYEFSEVAGESR